MTRGARVGLKSKQHPLRIKREMENLSSVISLFNSPVAKKTHGHKSVE